jgi:hypothetical protein
MTEAEWIENRKLYNPKEEFKFEDEEEEDQQQQLE